MPGLPHSCVHPTVAVLPFTSLGGARCGGTDGEMLAWQLQASLSTVPRLQLVPARQADYVLGGNFYATGGRLSLYIQLLSMRSRSPVWATQLHGVVHPEGLHDHTVSDAVEHAARAILSHAMQLVREEGTTQHFSILLHGAAGLTHQPSVTAFAAARPAFEQAVAIHPQSGLALAWLAHWSLQLSLRGWAAPGPQLERAYAFGQRALDRDPDCAFVLAMDGFVRTRQGDFAGAQASLARAVAIDPAEPWAWLFQSVLHAFREEGEPALACITHARMLAPLDPLIHFYHTLGATAAAIAGRYDLGLGLARQSLQGNTLDGSSLRAMAVSQVYLGDGQRARATIARARAIAPALTLRSYRESLPVPDAAVSVRVVEALREAGLPE